MTDGRQADAPADRLPAPGDQPLWRLAATVPRGPRPDRYTTELLQPGLAKVAQKVGEEAVEVVVAAHAEDDRRLASGAADLLYHLTVLLKARGVPLDAVLDEPERRGV